MNWWSRLIRTSELAVAATKFPSVGQGHDTLRITGLQRLLSTSQTSGRGKQRRSSGNHPANQGRISAMEGNANLHLEERNDPQLLSKLPLPFASYMCDEGTRPPQSHVLITASFGRILTRKHLEHFLPTRRLNVHPSLLPHYRGPAPIQHSIMHGDEKTGVCVIEMLPAAKKNPDKQVSQKTGIDAGDVWARRTVVCQIFLQWAQKRTHGLDVAPAD